MRIAWLLLALLAPLPVAAQGLGDTAARERKKREEAKAPASAKVYTNRDLPRPAEPQAAPATASDSATPGPEGPADGVKPPGAATTAEGAAAEAAPPATDPLEEESRQRKLLEAEWRVRFANAREELAKAEADSWHEVVRTEYYQGVPVQMKIKEQVETEELKRARQAMADLEEEFRRTGLPPGWARER